MRGGILSVLQTHSEVFLVFWEVFRDVPCSGVPENTICRLFGLKLEDHKLALAIALYCTISC